MNTSYQPIRPTQPIITTNSPSHHYQLTPSSLATDILTPVTTPLPISVSISRVSCCLWIDDHHSSKLLPGSVLDRSALTMQFRQEMAHRALHLQQELDQEEEEHSAMAAANLFKPRPLVPATTAATTTLQDYYNNNEYNNSNNTNNDYHNVFEGSLGLAPGLALVGLSSTEALTEGLSSSLHLLSSSQEQGLGPALEPGPGLGPGPTIVPSQKPQKQLRKSQHNSMSNPPSQESRFVLSREGLLVKPPDPHMILQNSQRRTNSRGLSSGGASAQRRARGGGNPLSAPTPGLGPGLGPGQGPGGDQEADVGFEERSQTPLVLPDLLHRMSDTSPGHSPSHKGQWADSMSDRCVIDTPDQH